MVYSWSEEDRVRDCAISADGNYLVVAATSRTLYVYDMPGQRKLHQLSFDAELTCVSISRDSKTILLNRDNQIIMIDLDTAEILKKFSHGNNTNRRYIFRSRFGGANDRFVITGSEGKLLISLFCCWFPLHYLSVVECTTSILLMIPDSMVYVWHRESGAVAHSFPAHPKYCVNTVVWNPMDEGMLASVGDDSTLKMYVSASPHANRRYCTC